MIKKKISRVIENLISFSFPSKILQVIPSTVELEDENGEM